MTSEAFERRPLGEALRDQIDGRKTLAAVFTTFSFDPAFFATHVLPLLFARGFSKEPAVRFIELDEELRSVPVAVYYDRGAVDAGRGSGPLGVTAYGIRRATSDGVTKGCFHPKLVLVLVRDTAGVESLVVAVMSANLTEGGHWTNVECVWIDEMSSTELCGYKDDLERILESIQDEARGYDTHDALRRVLRFLRSDAVQQAKQRTQDGRLQPRLFYGQRRFSEFVADILKLPADVYHLEVISPFFDDAKTLEEFQQALRPKSTRIFLPRRSDGTATCTKVYFDAVRRLNAEWARFVDAGYVQKRRTSPDDEQRAVHAKVYRLWSDAEKREFVIVGSVNLTEPAHSLKRSGNFEVAVVLESDAPTCRRFLQPIEKPPTDYGAGPDLDDIDENRCAPSPLLLRFFWQAKRLEAQWDARTASPAMELVVNGVRLSHPIATLAPVTWTSLPELASEIEPHLLRTSLVQVEVANSEPSWIIVKEEETIHKPSLLLTLTVDEILQYWSSLSDAQRQAVLERADVRQARLAAGNPPLATHDTMFDRFAGVFHAFERLREQVEAAITEDRVHDAEYRLFGAKYDSVPALVERLLEKNESEAEGADEATMRLAVSYCTLKSVARLVNQLEASSAQPVREFLDVHRSELRRLQAKLEDSALLRARIVDEIPVNGSAFLDWFDDWFVRDWGMS